jgi:hypothetical protein
MATKKPMMMKPAGKKAAPFKPCAGCKMPGKCAAVGKCLGKAKK